MTTRELESSQPRDLARVARDAAALLDQRIAAARPVPDFADMLLRARELAPDRVSEAAVARAAALPPVVPIEQGGHGDQGDVAALAPFAAALRAELDAKIAERRMASIPPVPLPRRPRRVGVILGLAVALAAAVVLMLVRATEFVRHEESGGAQASDQSPDGPGGEARLGGPGRYVLEARPDGGVAKVVSVLPDSPEGGVARVVPVLPDSPPREAAVPGELQGAGGLDMPPVLEDSPEAPRPRARTRPAEPGPGPSLEDEAQALWERGELAAAEQKLRQVLAIARRSGRAELAYGDLFALVRQLRGSGGQVEVWREYLQRFPAGRFADDVRAGLCLRAAADLRGACWRDYLEHHPRGIHKAQAEAALAEASP